MKPNWRVHSVITKGGAKPNIIPEYAELLTYIRAPDLQELDMLLEKVTCCYEAAGKATGCKVKVEHEDTDFIDVQQNAILASIFGGNYSKLGVEFGDISDTYASTDMGNLSPPSTLSTPWDQTRK